jgi:hypothetical protein
MRIDVSPRRKNAGRPREKSAPQFLQWLRGRPCLVGGTCAGKIEAAHVDHAGGKGMGTKVADKFAIPLCSAHHAEQHMAGRKTFEARHRINMLGAAQVYWSKWPGRYKWEAENGGTDG